MTTPPDASDEQRPSTWRTRAPNPVFVSPPFGLPVDQEDYTDAIGQRSPAAPLAARQRQARPLTRGERIVGRILKWDLVFIAMMSLVTFAVMFDSTLRYMSPLTAAGAFVAEWIPSFWLPVAVAAGCYFGPRVHRQRQEAARQVARKSAEATRRHAEAMRRYEQAVERREHVEATVTAEVAAKVVHGEPGRGLSIARFGDKAKAGAEGERRTVAALQPVLERFPAARLFNGLRWPGMREADIDHVLAVAGSVAVIDSKMWGQGNYSWDGRELWHSGTKRELPKVAEAAKALTQMLNERTDSPVQARAWVVIHASGPVIIEHSASSPFSLVTPDQLVEQVGTWLFATARDDRLIRDVIAVLLELMLPESERLSSAR